MSQIDGVNDLCGDDAQQAESAKAKIVLAFQNIINLNVTDYKEKQLKFATKVLYAIVKNDSIHTQLYTDLICKDFGNKLDPDINGEQWTFYIECVRYLFHKLANQKKYAECWQIIQTVNGFKSKVKSERCGKMIAQIYCYHFILQINHYQVIINQKNLNEIKKQQILDETNYILEAFCTLLQEMQLTHKTMNFNYSNIVMIVLKCIFPRINLLSFVSFYTNTNIKHFTNMLTKLFQMYDDQSIKKDIVDDNGKDEYADSNRNEPDIIGLKKDITKYIYCLLQLDFNGDYGLTPIFIKTILKRSQRLKINYKISPDFMQYLQLLLEFIEFLNIYSKRSKNNNKTIEKSFINSLNNICEKYKLFLKNVVVNTLTEMWFSNSLILYLYILSNLLDMELFYDFWQQMQEPQSYEAIILLTTVIIKLCSNISRDVSLYGCTCCTSIRKHVVLALAQNILAIFIMYCRTENIKTIEMETEQLLSNKKIKSNNYNTIDSIKSNIGVIMKYALNIFNQMDCIDADAPDTKLFITRLKRIAASLQTKQQLSVYELLTKCLFLYKDKLSSTDLIGLMKYYYLAVKQSFPEDIQMNREIFLCYIVILLNESNEIDWQEIRGYIGNYYEIINKETAIRNNNENIENNNKENNNENIQHIFSDENDKNKNNKLKDNNKNDIKSLKETSHMISLYEVYKNIQNALLWPLNMKHSNILFWCDMQYLIKYQKNNTKLIQSLFMVSSIEYYRVILARFQKKEKSILNWLERYHHDFFVKEQQLFENFDELTNQFNSKIFNNSDQIKKNNYLNRLEALIYGHCCVLLLQQEQDRFKGKLSDFTQIFEQNLDQLIQTDSILNNIIINNENSKCMHYTIVIYRAFKYFFEMIRLETVVSSDDVLIEWEFLLEDLEYIAYFVQLNGNLEFALDIWLLHYKCSKYLNHHYGMFQGLTYFCEHSYLFTECSKFGGETFLNQELLPIYRLIVLELEFLNNNFVNSIQKHRQYNIVLMLITQIAYYFAINHNYNASNSLLKLVEINQDKINKFQGKEIYNCVMATYDLTRIRIFWKLSIEQNDTIINGSYLKKLKSSDDCNQEVDIPYFKSTHRDLISYIEDTLERYRHYASLYPNDFMIYSITLMNLLQDITECCGNRLTDINVQGFYLAALRLAIEAGLTLRFINLMINWMWMNLQHEYVDKAEMKLKIILYVLKLKSPKELRKLCIKITSPENPLTAQPDEHNAGSMDAVRKIVPLELSPIREEEKLHDVTLKVNLMRFVCFKAITPMCQELEKQMLPTYKKLFKWSYFAVGCLVARLYYLAGDHKQLDNYYKESIRWLNIQNNNLYYPWQSHIRTIHYQYYANYLHSQKCYKEARQCLEMSAAFINKQKSLFIDTEYCLNICYQLEVINIDMNNNKTLKPKKIEFEIEQDEQLSVAIEKLSLLQTPNNFEEINSTIIDLTATSPSPSKGYKVNDKSIINDEGAVIELNDNKDSTRSKKKPVVKRDCAMAKFNLNKKLSAPLLILEDETSATLSSSSSTSPYTSSTKVYSPKRTRTLRNRRIELNSNDANGHSGSAQKVNTKSISSRRRRDI